MATRAPGFGGALRVRVKALDFRSTAALVLVASLAACAGDGAASEPEAAAGGREGNGGSPAGGAGDAEGGTSEGGDAQTSGGAPAGSAGEAEGGSGEGGDALVGEPPILERPPRIAYDCGATTELVKLGIPNWSGGELAAGESRTLFLHSSSSPWAPEDDPLSVRLSSIDSSGSRNELTLLESDAVYLYDPKLVASTQGFGAVWGVYDGDSSHRSFAALDAEGAVLTPPFSPDGLPADANGLDIEAAGDGYALFWAAADAEGLEAALWFAVLGADGVFEVDPVEVERGPWFQAKELAAFGDGFVAAYLAAEDVELFLQFLAADGTARGEPISLGPVYIAPIVGYTGATLLPRGDELLVGHTIEAGDPSEQNRAGVFSIARFDAAGSRIGPEVLLEAAVDDVEDVAGRLVAYGSDVGILWSRGSVIYLCGGCMPDHHLRFVVADGDDLTPLSEVVILENLEPQGGFLFPSVAHDGSEFLIASSLEYHTSGDAAFASIACAASE